ncbi:uncharacterized protein MAM_05584 [Metarhizium album ARSEF 1941]|uniref:Uncharacterized protein n=1 Tax=Metarhizium album (strain ARSEF 1941) TaxID=1081103 RepID=A0A0B2WKQ6_METAS|nr:uncharacterized protein MAM_05584 [Metarhizium album ARSEF 1941]KHN96641.1 hypothetical protein MAM_05584 [Metarhizium album ARSEF 1941]
MGAESRKVPPLPAPTETDTTTPSELATDLSKPGDEKSSYSIPEDGTPVTIRTRGHKASKSQTSLLIEYFEGGKTGSGGQDRKPSVRVRLTPSKKSRGDHIQVSETKGSRKASLTRRSPLDQAIASREIELHDGEDANSMTSYASATEESNVSRNPIDIEIDRSHRRRRPASPLIPSAESYQPGNPSEISAIPTDSFLDGSGPAGDSKRSSSPVRAEALIGATAAAGVLGGAAMGEMSSSKARAKERVKMAEKSKDKSDKKRHSKSRASSVASERAVDETRSPRRRSSRGHQESNTSAADSSVVSSHLAPSHRSLDTRSVRSGASRTSINNPKLLETVEDAIRRLILPELSALKREQSKRESRRGSLTSSATSVSREDVSSDRRRSSDGRGESSRDGARHKDRRNREARHDYDDDISLRSPSHGSINAEYEAHEGDVTSPRRSNNLLKAAAAGAAGAALAKGAGSAMDDVAQSPDRKQRERRRRRAENTGSRGSGREQFDTELDEEHLAPEPPMPLMSDVNPSEVTRTSILSAESDRPHSASEELVAAPARDLVHGEQIASGASTPARAKSPVNQEQHALAMHHANVSHGDLTALPRGNKDYVEEYETDEYGRKVPVGCYDDYGRSRVAPEPADYPEDDFEERYYSTQDVPPPLRYVPYQAGARGLSPIPSVSGYTEAGSEAPPPRDSMEMPSPARSPERTRQHLSLQPDGSAAGNVRSRELDRVSPDGGQQFDETATGQAVRGIGANPKFVNSPIGVESAVASLVDGSMLDQSVVTGASGNDQNAVRDSNVSYEEPHKTQSSRGVGSPERMDVDPREVEDEWQTTPGPKSVARHHEYSEYDVDEHGRKVPRAKHRHSPTASEAAITAGAVGAAAAALKAAKERKQAVASGQFGEDFQPAGVARNRSFKERTMHHGWEPRNTPTHSIDRLDLEEQAPKLGASGLPDMDDPMPEIGYVDDELQTNPSIVDERLDGEPVYEEWSGRATPTPRDMGGYAPEAKGKEAEVGGALGVTEAVGAAALGAAAAMAAAHSHDASQDEEEWHRTSDERKRDTLLTNPYEDASPIVNPELNDKLLSRGLEAPFNTGSPGFGQKYDEGYMSNGPNRTPDPQVKGKAVDLNAAVTDDDPFYVPKSHARHTSGMSQGMASPFYDAATGVGIERIENKDIVALMQHLMVRDAQRSARDTEIVALLMNAALEMRNSFREMKELVQDTGDDVIFANVENTEKLQKAMSVPRPYPGAASRSLQSPSQAGTFDEAAAKKKTLWKRALQGLSAKGTNDLTRIEDMLMQLLGEVDVLKTQTAPAISIGGPGQSVENVREEDQLEQDRGHGPDGISTPTPATQPGTAASASQSRAHAVGGVERKFSEHRISTVPENEEECRYDHVSPRAERSGGDHVQTPTQAEQIQRGGSVPLETPPRLAPPADPQPLSAENTPRTDRGKKHKSSSSSGWLPKISRWSGTTASSVGKALRGSSSSKKGPKYDDFQPPSRSGSSLASYDDDQTFRHDPYGQDKLHSGFSDPSLQGIGGERRNSQGPPPTSHMSPEDPDPKYKAHRNSLNLQHPQPRPGQTERFRTALESSAQEYSNPMTPRSTDWAGSATSLNRLPPNTNRFSNTSSVPGPEADYYLSAGQQSGPPRPPKEPMGSPGPQTPPKATRLSKMQKEGSPAPQQSSESGYGTMTGTYLSHCSGSSPRLENRNLNAALGVPSRRPSGPRAMTPKSPEEETAREERRRKRDTFGTVASEDTDTF